jgi:glutamate synthase (NADPH/NADH)
LLHSLIAEHGERTGSTVAKALLQDWFTTKKQFVKVFPRDYKRVLESQKTASANEIEEEVLGETDAFEKLKAISSLATPVTPANNALPENVTKDLPIKKVRPTRSAAPTKLKGFVAYERETLGYRDASERLLDWKEVHFPYNDAAATETLLATQSARCMDCGTPFCHNTNTGCPLGNKIPEWNDLVNQNRWRDALDRLHETNNFPEFTGRVCPAPCEGSCVLGIIENPVAIKVRIARFPNPDTLFGPITTTVYSYTLRKTDTFVFTKRASSAPSWTGGSRRAGSSRPRPRTGRARRSR